MAGAVRQGLDYSALTPAFREGQGIEPKDWPRVFQSIRVMEAAALDALAKQRESHGHR